MFRTNGVLKSQKLSVLVLLFCSVLLVVSMVLNPFINIAQAESKPNLEDYEDVTLTPEEEAKAEKLAEDLEFLFEETIVEENGEYVIRDKGKVIDYFGEEHYDEINNLVAIINGDESVINNGDAPGNVSTMSWVDCVKGELVNAYGAVYRAFFTGTVGAYIAEKKYMEAAKLIAKASVKAGLKVSAITLAAELSWYAIKCGVTADATDTIKQDNFFKTEISRIA